MTSMHSHTPQITVEEVAKSRTEPTEGKFPPLWSRSLHPDNEIPGVVEVNTNDFGSRGSDLIQTIMTTILDTTANVQSIFKHLHRECNFIEVAPIGTINQHWVPLVRRVPAGVCFPNLEPAHWIQSARVQCVV